MYKRQVLRVKPSDKMLGHRRNLYNNIPRGHPDSPSIINIAKPHNLNPGKYDDLKIILRKEGQNVGIKKYGTGTREWFATVCDGSPYKLFMGLVGELLFCKLCQLPVGDFTKHREESHNGVLEWKDIELEMGHILPLAGPGHVEKNLMTAVLQVLWNIVGLDLSLIHI